MDIGLALGKFGFTIFGKRLGRPVNGRPVRGGRIFNWYCGEPAGGPVFLDAAGWLALVCVEMPGAAPGRDWCGKWKEICSPIMGKYTYSSSNLVIEESDDSGPSWFGG